MLNYITTLLLRTKKHQSKYFDDFLIIIFHCMAYRSLNKLLRLL